MSHELYQQTVAVRNDRNNKEYCSDFQWIDQKDSKGNIAGKHIALIKIVGSFPMFLSSNSGMRVNLPIKNIEMVLQLTSVPD